jgi:uncharacterized protein (DUF58 family)
VLTERAWAVLGGGALLWVASRLVGSPDLHIVSVGLLALVPLGILLVRLRRHRLRATRRLSARRAFPGTRIRVEVEVGNLGEVRTSLLLLEDRLPSALGPPARLVIPHVPPGARQSVSYEFTPRRRGRYEVGPLVAQMTDPFDLARHRIEFDETHDLIVYPEVEPLEATQVASPIGGSGESSSRQLFRTGEEFYTMRHYEIGDDLRRIHWPSTARIGELMIRQDETARRAAAVIFLDSRRVATGAVRDGFEKGLSATASIGAHYLRAGYVLRLATPDLPPQQVGQEQFLETLALIQPSRLHVLSPSLQRLRSAGGANPALVVVTHPPDPEELSALSRISAVYGSKLAVLVVPQDIDDLYLRPRAEIERRVEGARLSLLRAGWDVLVLGARQRLSDIWQRRPKRPAPRTTAASS